MHGDVEGEAEDLDKEVNGVAGCYVSNTRGNDLSGTLEGAGGIRGSLSSRSDFWTVRSSFQSHFCHPARGRRAILLFCF